MNDYTIETPISWPAGRERTSPGARQVSRFYPGTMQAEMHQVANELERMDAENIVITCNAERDRYGRIKGTNPMLPDPGAAVYFDRHGQTLCIAIDKFQFLTENLRAIYRSVGAIRGLERWGHSSMVDMSLAGYAALPAQAGGRAWWHVLDIDRSATGEEIDAAYKRLAKVHHPDAGGRPELFAELTDARRMAFTEKAATGGR